MLKLMKLTIEYHPVGEFLKFCVEGADVPAAGEWASTFPGKYLDGGQAAGGQLIDEGEVRMLMVGAQVQTIIRKKPMDGRSAVGGHSFFTYYEPGCDEYADLENKFVNEDVPNDPRLVRRRGRPQYGLDRSRGERQKRICELLAKKPAQKQAALSMEKESDDEIRAKRATLDAEEEDAKVRVEAWLDADVAAEEKRRAALAADQPSSMATVEARVREAMRAVAEEATAAAAAEAAELVKNAFVSHSDENDGLRTASSLQLFVQRQGGADAKRVLVGLVAVDPSGPILGAFGTGAISIAVSFGAAANTKAMGDSVLRKGATWLDAGIGGGDVVRVAAPGVLLGGMNTDVDVDGHVKIDVEAHDNHHNAGDANKTSTELAVIPDQKEAAKHNTGTESVIPDQKEAAEGLEEAIKGTAWSSVEGLFAGFEVGDLVATPGNMASVLGLWVFFVQKIGLQVNVDVAWPPWFSDVLDILAWFTLDVPSVSVNISDGVWNSCSTAVKLLVAFVILARALHLHYRFFQRVDFKQPPPYHKALSQQPMKYLRVRLSTAPTTVGSGPWLSDGLKTCPCTNLSLVSSYHFARRLAAHGRSLRRVISLFPCFPM